MSKIKRILTVFSGFLLIVFALTILFIPEDAFWLASFVIAFILLVKGIIHIFYYLSMAHHMVGGKIILFYGIFMFDLGVFAVSISDKSRWIIIIYLIAGHLIAGGIETVKAIRSMKEGHTNWKFDITRGIINILIAGVCILCIDSANMLILIFSVSMIYIAIVEIVSAFKKTAVVYIQ
ncbi:MAG: DUF308 domain-containing protein [Clostridiales bacterium]|nr:DUF308 domain-containing protein [Clostridiales bacterium]